MRLKRQGYSAADAHRAPLTVCKRLFRGGGGGSRSGGGTHETHALKEAGCRAAEMLAVFFFGWSHLVPVAARLWCILRRVFLPFLLEDVAGVWDDAEGEVVPLCCT
jgi:hypothetical protein